ncbi:MAG TPA: HlyD family efflux transporter periplasmic adaptor subunit [Smithella sp.]|nr:HlyD family efflux transporter periplasmic adaptor subunit [Smithella sp.]MDM7988067.1 HlyD family efflux transporter periplasmic adaptor subunit [Smithella sp.]HNY49236.1 HlyD family efflux transporter periplasmic adaptor subunit [Smithella sp.]HOG88923.1 HlyD family efflux transporter periplasmic adaptor subunit [Smithella sp.]HOU49681.1 HlyD family efflux transporter periplasmic adaptor subunit [Smithella sp.]
MKKRIIAVVFIILFVTVGSLVYVGQKNNQQKELYYSGTIEATQSNLSFQAPGRVLKINVDEGQAVAKDQILAELDRAEFESRLAQARANLERSQKTKQQLETVLAVNQKTLPSEVARAKAGVQSAKDTFKNAEKNYRRFEDLFGKGVVSEKERDALKLQYDIAQSRLEESQSVLKLAEGNLTRIDAVRQEIEVAAAQINAAQASLNQASIQLDYTQLKSPVKGIVTSRNIEPGETVTVGREVITVSDPSRVDLKIFVDETEIGKVKPGQKVDVQVDTFPGKTYSGMVSFVSPEGEFTPKIIQTKKERVKLVYLVKVSIDNPNLELKAGMPADAWLK